MAAYKSINYEKLLGQRVSLSSDKTGILRYCGVVSFAPGVWCGVELDEAVGDNNGSINNVHYFSCKKNYGLFCHASEILSDPSLSQIGSDAPSEDTCFQYQDFSADLKFVLEEASKNINDEVFSSKDSLDSYPEDLDKHSPPQIEFSYDSDDSLGILPLNILVDETETNNDSCLDIMLDSHSFHKSDSKQDSFTNLNILNEDLFPVNDSFSQFVTPALHIRATLSSEVESNLNLTQVIHPPEEQSNLNITQIIYPPEEQKNFNDTEIINTPEEQGNVIVTQADYASDEQSDLNVTVTFHNPAIESKAIEKETSIDVKCSSPIYRVPKILRGSKSDENTSHKTVTSPKYASTPKHETNYTFVLDEEFLNSEQIFSPVSHFNKTVIKEDKLKGKAVFAQNDVLDPEYALSSKTDALPSDILNVTCNIEKPTHYQCELNKTYDNSYSDEKGLPAVKSHDKPSMNTTITFSEELGSKTFDLKENKMDEIQVSNFCDAMIDKTVQDALNTTVSLEENANCAKSKDISLKELNTTISVSKDLEEAFDVKEKQDMYNAQSLNTTYEKIDLLPELPKIEKTSQVKKCVVKETKNTKESKIAKRIPLPSTVGASSSKLVETDKKKVRKSMIFPIRSNNKDVMNKKNLNKRKTLGSISFKRDNNILSHESSPTYVHKQCLAVSTTSDLKSLRAHSSNENISNRYLVKGETSTKSEKSEHKSLKCGSELLKNSSAHSSSVPETGSRKTEEAKSSSKSQNIALDETMNIATSVSDTEGTALKRPYIPSKKVSAVPRFASAASSARCAVPVPKQPKESPKASFPTIGSQEKKIALSGLSEKRILSQRNVSSSGGGAGLSTALTSKKQSLDSKSFIPGMRYEVIQNRPGSILQSAIPISRSKKRDSEDFKSEVIQSKPGSSFQSKIPFSASQKKGSEERVKSQRPEKPKIKSPSCRNLR